MTREERRAAIELTRKVSQIIAHLEEIDGRECVWTWSAIIELTQEVMRFERGENKND